MAESFAEFHETLTLAIPKIDDRLLEFAESRSARKRGLVVEVAAIHSGLTANFNNYSVAELERSLNSWVSPYPKPIILNHDIENAEPVGRVMAAKMDTEDDGSRYVRLQVAVTDPQAIEKVLDQRYLTGSVGGRSDEAVCSVCQTDWAKANMSAGLPCKHQRGKTYKGTLAYLDRRNLSFKEYSFVNAPADSRSMVLGSSATEADDEMWVRPARFFDLNMAKEEIVEYTESESRNVLQGMRKKESSPLYLSLKGAFLSALAVAESDQPEPNDKENSAVSDKTEEQEDILAVTEELSSDLAATQTEESAEEVEEEDSTAEEGEVDGAEGDVVESDAGDEDATDQGDGSESTEAEDVEESTDEVAEGSFDAAFDDQYLTQPATDTNFDPRTREDKRPQAQEREGRVYHDTMKDPTRPSPINNPDPFADHTRESEEEGDAAAEAEAEEETGLEEKLADLERRVQEAEDQKTALLEENARLKKALHRTLVERVVDQKIALGLVTVEDRAEQLEEHATRTAASLADSLRDLSGMTATIQRPDLSKVETIAQKLMAVDDDGSTIESDASTTETKDPVSQMEDVLVDALMGRRKL